MDLEKIFKQETGFDAFIDNNLEPKIPMGYYVEWLEEKVTERSNANDLEIIKHIEDNCRNIHGEKIMDEQTFFEGAKWYRDRLNKAILKAKPNMDKIDDVDEFLGKG